jgi:hypothetical protein
VATTTKEKDGTFWPRARQRYFFSAYTRAHGHRAKAPDPQLRAHPLFFVPPGTASHLFRTILLANRFGDNVFSLQRNFGVDWRLLLSPPSSSSPRPTDKHDPIFRMALAFPSFFP